MCIVACKEKRKDSFEYYLYFWSALTKTQAFTVLRWDTEIAEQLNVVPCFQNKACFKLITSLTFEPNAQNQLYSKPHFHIFTRNATRIPHDSPTELESSSPLLIPITCCHSLWNRLIGIVPFNRPTRAYSTYLQNKLTNLPPPPVLPYCWHNQLKGCDKYWGFKLAVQRGRSKLFMSYLK